ncbi:hypothetical protein BST30_10325 [Mycobacterium mantenii]|uniref:Uncharacterized protein n=1 Tax=Mycobacterium mantenii TaxID=560555 RepID=A0A1X0FYI6_MYCNT|nr:hypothetical protein BST30_10325 [Mycobacterium mantenii]
MRRLQLYLLALPDDDQTRTRYEGDIVLWYSVVVHTGNWEANSNANATMISEDKINLLGSLGQILSYQSSLKPAPNVEMLKASLAEWATLLEEAELPPDLAAKIRAEIEQIEFLLSEAETYGLEPLAEHGRSLFGLGLSVIKVTGTVGTVVSAMSNLFQFITQVSVNDYGGAVNALAGVFSSVNDVFTLASEEAQQKAIAAKKQKELLAKPDEEPSEVIDGEVVDDSSTKPHI